MSGTGTFYEIDDAAGSALAGLESKSVWYDTLGLWLKAPLVSLDCEQALQYGWIWALRNEPAPLGAMFTGDCRTAPDGTGDPEVVFLGKDRVLAIAKTLRARERGAFAELLGPDRVNEIWLLEPMRAFFETAASRSRAIVVLYGD